MKPSYHPHSTHPDISPSQHVTCDVAAAGVAEATGFARDPPSRAHPSFPPARQTSWPYRVHFRLGLVFRLAQLPTTHRCAAVALGYPSVPRPRRTQTFTGWFHGFISARNAKPQLGESADPSPSWGSALPGGGPCYLRVSLGHGGCNPPPRPLGAPGALRSASESGTQAPPAG